MITLILSFVTECNVGICAYSITPFTVNFHMEKPANEHVF